MKITFLIMFVILAVIMTFNMVEGAPQRRRPRPRPFGQVVPLQSGGQRPSNRNKGGTDVDGYTENGRR